VRKPTDSTQIINEFLRAYTREFDYWERAAQMCARLLETQLRSNVIRAMVTSRAKRPDRLREKLSSRGKPYTSSEDIYSDIKDLAGVRVAIYFPSEFDDVERLIIQCFAQVSPGKLFPSDSKRSAYTGYNPRFPGYRARHYCVRMLQDGLQELDRRYCDATVEIQVASVLMHAWAEVEHDLVYKPLQGRLSEDEYAILDELNGLVLAGELALERLQRAADRRLSEKEKHFGNYYELAAYIHDRLAHEES